MAGGRRKNGCDGMAWQAVKLASSAAAMVALPPPSSSSLSSRKWLAARRRRKILPKRREKKKKLMVGVASQAEKAGRKHPSQPWPPSSVAVAGPLFQAA